jgi:hypothetical protein
MENTELILITKVNGEQLVYDGPLSFKNGEFCVLDADKTYILAQSMGPNGQIQISPIRMDMSPFAPDKDIKLNTSNISEFWNLSHTSDIYKNFGQIKTKTNAAKSGIVLA